MAWNLQRATTRPVPSGRSRAGSDRAGHHPVEAFCTCWQPRPTPPLPVFFSLQGAYRRPGGFSYPATALRAMPTAIQSYRPKRPASGSSRLPSPCGSSQRSRRRNTSADPFSGSGAGAGAPAIVTASRKTSTRFGPVQDLDAEEHQRRGDAAVELFREIVRRATGDGRT